MERGSIKLVPTTDVYRITYTFTEVDEGSVPEEQRGEIIEPFGDEKMSAPVASNLPPEDEDELRRKAYHEAGHALMWLLGRRGIGRIGIRHDHAFVDPGKEQMRDGWVVVEVALAGGIAQRIFTKKEPLPMEVLDDENRARQQIAAVYPPERQEEVYAVLHDRTERAMRENWVAVDALARAIIASERTVEGRDMDGPVAERILREHLTPPTVSTID